jgi:primosomal protein N' (replication factor Y)
MSAKEKLELKILAKKLHTYLKDRVVNEKYGLLLYSPVPSPIDKIKDRYRYRMIIKCIYDDKVNNLLSDMLELYNGFNNKTSRVSVEVNPYNML